MTLDAANPDCLTVLHSHPRCPQTKIFQPGFNGPAQACSRAKYYRAEVMSFASYDLIEENLSSLQTYPSAVVVYGALAPSADRRHMQRKYSGNDATLIAVPRKIAIFDCEKIPTPECLIGRKDSLSEAAAHVRSKLPIQFQYIECVALASSSYLTPGKNDLRFRFFFLLSKALFPNELKEIVAECPYIDTAPLHPAGLNYVARPIFLGGSKDDPLPNGRIVRLKGAPCVSVTPPSKLIPVAENKQIFLPLRKKPGNRSHNLETMLLEIAKAHLGTRRKVVIKCCHAAAENILSGSWNYNSILSVLSRAAACNNIPEEVIRDILDWSISVKGNNYNTFEKRDSSKNSMNISPPNQGGHHDPR